MTHITKQLQHLFQICLELRQEFNKLDREADILKEIAMNAAVTAGQTGRSIRIYTEISNQIAFSSKKMKSWIDVNRNEVNIVLNLTLKAFSLKNLNRQFLLGEETVTHQGNKKYIQEKIEASNDDTRQLLSGIIAHVFSAKSFLKNLLQVQYRLFGSNNCILIESIYLDGEQYSAIKALSENLTLSYENSIRCIEKLFTILKRITRIVKIIEKNSFQKEEK